MRGFLAENISKPEINNPNCRRKSRRHPCPEIEVAGERFAVVDSLQVGSHFPYNMRLRSDVWTH
jgi:hypothetical protein